MFEVMPYRGAGPLKNLRRQMDEVPLAQTLGAEGAFTPSVDVKETDSAIEVTAEIPGLKPEEIEVSLTGDMLSIKGEKREEKEEKKDNYHLVERRFGSFSRSFRLPVEVVPDKIEAKHKDGVLHLVLPKGEKEPTTKIKVKTE